MYGIISDSIGRQERHCQQATNIKNRQNTKYNQRQTPGAGRTLMNDKIRTSEGTYHKRITHRKNNRTQHGHKKFVK